jgi:hypothetical protein
MLRLLFAECDTSEVLTAFERSGFLPHFEKLQQTHQAFENLSRQEIRAEAEASSEAGSGNVASPDGAKGPESAVAGLSSLSTRELKELASESLWLIFVTASRHAAKEREPYGHLLAQCTLIAQEVNKVAKGRITRAKKAQQKEAAKAAQGAPRAEAPTAAAAPREGLPA